MSGMTGRIYFFIIVSFSLLSLSVFSVDAFSDVSLKDNMEVSSWDYLSYHMSPGDILEINVFEVEELSRTVRVD